MRPHVVDGLVVLHAPLDRARLAAVGILRATPSPARLAADARKDRRAVRALVWCIAVLAIGVGRLLFT